MSRDISENLYGLERDLSKLKAERDLTVAEVEELVLVKGYVHRLRLLTNTLPLNWSCIQRVYPRGEYNASTISHKEIRQHQGSI
jgi:hypothetical protein